MEIPVTFCILPHTEPLLTFLQNSSSEAINLQPVREEGESFGSGEAKVYHQSWTDSTAGYSRVSQDSGTANPIADALHSLLTLPLENSLNTFTTDLYWLAALC